MGDSDNEDDVSSDVESTSSSVRGKQPSWVKLGNSDLKSVFFLERSAQRKVAISAVSVFSVVIRQRLKLIKNNVKVDEIFVTYLPNLLTDFVTMFVVNKRKEYPYTASSYLHLQLSPTGYEIADPEYNG